MVIFQAILAILHIAMIDDLVFRFPDGLSFRESVIDQSSMNHESTVKYALS